MVKTLAAWYRRPNSELPIEHHLGRVARAHRGKALLVVLPWQAVCDHRGYIQARLQHHGHQIPGFIHLATVDPLDRDHVEDDFTCINCQGLGRNAKHRDWAAVANMLEHLLFVQRVTGLWKSDVESS